MKWSYPTQSTGWEIHSSSPIVTKNGVVIVGNNEGDTYWALLDDTDGPILLDTFSVDVDGNAQASATISTDGYLYLPLRTVWTVGNGDGKIPTQSIENIFTAFDLR